MREIETVDGRDDLWRVGDTEFLSGYETDSTPARFRIRKHAPLMALYSQLCVEFHGSRIFELGIAAGGSTALLALAAEPAKLVACDLAAEPVEALDAFIARHHLDDVIHAFYGVDQSDRRRLTGIVDAEFGDEPIDLVVDDASHLYDPTVASFDVLFPRIRPGGRIIIEDWPADYLRAAAIAKILADKSNPRSGDVAKRLGGAVYRHSVGREVQPQPLARVAQQLVLAAAASPEVVENVTIDKYWITVTRGPARVDTDTFALDNLYDDYFGWLSEEGPTGARR